MSDFNLVPPHDVEAEQSVLGAMMMSAEAIGNVVEVMEPGDYYFPKHQTLHQTIMELYGREEPVDAITVAGELDRQGNLISVGGVAYLHELIAMVPSVSNAAYYAKIVVEKSKLRNLVTAGTRITQIGYSGEGNDVDYLIDQAQAEVMAVTDRQSQSDYEQIGVSIEKTVDELQELQKNGKSQNGVPTGFYDLDKLTNGLQPGQLIIIAARPAMGKSTLALDFCRNASVHNKQTSVIFSLEMDQSEIAKRMLAAESGVSMARMNSGEMTGDDWQRIAKALQRVTTAPLFVDDSPNMSMAQITAKCRRLKQKEDLKLVVVDYLQLMSSGKRVESRQQEVAEFSRNLKLLAKSIGVPVIAVAQLNRGPEQRTDHKPQLSDLRESGSLEQDADIVMLLNRPSVYDENDRPGEADVYVAKHRNGSTAVISLTFMGHLSKFGNPAR